MTRLAALHARTEALLGAQIFKFVRFLIAGGVAAASNLAVFFVLVQFAHVYYLYASIAAFVMSIGVSFTMQKFWTFRDMLLSGMHAQFARYILVISINLTLNTSLVYLFVEKLGIWSLFAQALATVIIATTGYLGYQYFVFRDRVPTPTP